MSGSASYQARVLRRWQSPKFTFPFAGPALPVEIWEVVLDCLVGAKLKELLNLSLVCRHWWTRCRPYLVRNIVFNNRGDVLREHRTRRRDWAGPRCVTIVGTENTKSLGHLGFVAALLGPRWPNVRDVVIEHGDWRAGDFHQDIFHHLHTLLEKITSLRFHDVTFPSGAILRGLISQTHSLEDKGTLALAQVRFENASMPPTSLSWMSHGNPRGEYVEIQLNDLNTTSLDVIAHWLLVAPDMKHAFFPRVSLSLGTIDEPQPGTVPPIIPFLKTVGNYMQNVTLGVTRSLAQRLSLPQCPSIIIHNQDVQDLHLNIHVQESMYYGWLLRAISRSRTQKSGSSRRLRLDFIVDVHLRHGTVVPKGPECDGCALHPKPTQSFTGSGVLDDIIASLKPVCDVLDRVLWNIRDRQTLFKLHLDPGIWIPRLRTWFPKSRKSKVLRPDLLFSGRSITPAPILGVCDAPPLFLLLAISAAIRAIPPESRDNRHPAAVFVKLHLYVFVPSATGYQQSLTRLRLPLPDLAPASLSLAVTSMPLARGWPARRRTRVVGQPTALPGVQEDYGGRREHFIYSVTPMERDERLLVLYET
ncbi:predicted protein [Postia placenta Mad-698-R]|nr:predicted protein [Postia placenta Mad-698-R]